MKDGIIHLAGVFPYFECGERYIEGKTWFTLERIYSTCPECNKKVDCKRD